MRFITRVLLILAVTYIIIGKAYTTIFYLQTRRLFLENFLLIYLPNLVVIAVGMFVINSVLKKELVKTVREKLTLLGAILLLYTVVMQLLVGLLEYLNKSSNIDQSKVILLGDLPNFLSIILVIGVLMLKYMFRRN